MASRQDICIAMWSGPRNISTALMRAWENRGDTFVCDEPFYAHYLAATNVEHPGRDEIIERGDTDWRQVSQWLTGPVPEDRQIFYQKHMAHHLLPGMMGSWLDRLRHAFLIRDPEEMLISLSKVMDRPRLEDTGLPQQVELFEHLRRTSAGVSPPVIDARDVLDSPAAMLRKLCTGLDVDFVESMLSWRPGPRPTDGVWAKFWYSNVESSTGFRVYEPPTEALPSSLTDVERECRYYYDELYSHRITV